MLSIERLSLEDAQVLIEGATEHANAIGVPMCIAIVDESGNLIAFHRMDGGKILSVSLSQDKAFTAAVSRRPTSFYNENAVPGNLTNGIQSAWSGRFSTVGGGVPVEDDGIIVGAVGISGGTPEQDIECAEAAIAYFSAD
ncbi:MAG: heme-binding protein [Rhodospirillaceae bacterium]|nr:heme-binding protein [Rhodospirillaceae bacterium]